MRTLILLVLSALPLMQFAATWYVSSSSGSDLNDGKSWEHPFATIQCAVNAAESGECVSVADGVYSPVSGKSGVTIQSVNGYKKTVIDGGGTSICFSGNGDCILDGFTVRNGHAWSDFGGGAYGGIIRNCALTNNWASSKGGGAYSATLENCLLLNNQAHRSVAAYRCTMINCTLVGNRSFDTGDLVARYSTLYNCIVWNNPAGGCEECGMENCYQDDPGFNDAATGDYRLGNQSPCIDAGSNVHVSTTNDLSGNVRIVNGTVDIGAYEWQPPAQPKIIPASGSLISGSSLTVTITCDSLDVKIHYTTNGMAPTMESPVYKKFRIYGKTTIKATAFYDDGTAGKMSVAEYAFGNCAAPIVNPVGGSTFQHSNQQVLINWNEDDGALYYTLDGSDPTTNSLVYAGPFTIDETTTIKAKVFSDKYFDSDVVTATLTREWVKVATPTISALDTFTGTKCLVSISCDESGATMYYTVDGTTPTTSSPRYERSFYITDSTTIKVLAIKDDFTNSEIAEKSITRTAGVGDVLGSPDVQFTMGGNVGWIEDTSMYRTGPSSMRSAKNLPDGQTSEMSATVKGVGAVQFYWRTSCEDSEGQYDWDHAEFYADDKVYKIDAESNDWVAVSHTFNTYGTHTLRWVYTKDSAGKEGSDCVWVDDLVLNFDPIPDMGANPAADDIATATFGSDDTRIIERVTNATEYVRYQQWASGVEGSTKQQIKGSAFTWLSFALDANALLTANPKDGDISVSGIEPTGETGKFTLDISIAGVEAGENATAANLAQIFSVEGAAEVNGEYSSENVFIVFETPEDGKVKVTAGPKDETEESYFMKVKMNP